MVGTTISIWAEVITQTITCTETQVEDTTMGMVALANSVLATSALTYRWAQGRQVDMAVWAPLEMGYRTKSSYPRATL